MDDQKATVEEATIKFNKLIEEVFKLLPSEKFKRKSEADCASLRPRSSIELESLKTQKQSISVPQSKIPIATFNCVKKSLGAEEKDKDGILPNPTLISQVQSHQTG